jgi:hypothetical protein
MTEITLENLISKLPDYHSGNKYLGWDKLNIKDFERFEFVGVLESKSLFQAEFESEENYWSPNYPIAVEYFPNKGSEIYFDGNDYYMVYLDFGGHVPEKRCRLIRKNLIR